MKDDYKEKFNEAYQKSLTKLNEIRSTTSSGKTIKIDVDETKGWQQDKESGTAQHFTLEFPKEIKPEGKLIIGYVGQNYHGKSSFDFDRKIHVIRGRLKSNGLEVNETDKPIQIKANEMLELSSDNESIFFIDLIPNKTKK